MISEKKIYQWGRLSVSIAMLMILAISSCADTQHKLNRLKNASSPYLKEHADNPVDWYEWGEEALNKAKKENKPLLISIGYASCHWCHQMEKESFMDTAVAGVMNENFICIKVDREERPDIDNMYMNALQLLSGGGGGWPLNAFALPDGKPFFAGTYYSAQSWTNLLVSISKAFKTKHSLVIMQANALANGVINEELSLIGTSSLTPNIVLSDYYKLYDSIYVKADLINGGFKGAPKFPTPFFAEFLLQHYYISHNPETLKVATTTLKKMALGGIYDQVGGGFARYATDSGWRIPHFEKMLYDNGQMVSLYAHAYQLTKDTFYRKIFTETLAFIDKALAASGGGYYSSVNADTESGEGEYYSWTEKDFLKTVNEEKILTEYFHVTTPGNWNATGNILYANQPPDEFAIQKNISPAIFSGKLETAKKKLLAERNNRKKPSVDTKIITAWNSMLLKGYADAYAATGNEDYLQKAKACAAFIEKNMFLKNGTLKRSFNEGAAGIDGFLDDYAWTASALIRLYEVSFDKQWVTLSKKITDNALKTFFDAKTGLFYYSREQTSEPIRRKFEIADDDIPSSNAIMAKVLNSLGIVYDDTAYVNKSLKMYASIAQRIKKMPRFHLQWCNFTGLLAANSYEVVIMGKDAAAKNKEIQMNYLPTSIFMGSKNEEDLPLLEFKLTANKTLIFVCTNKVCKKPEEDVAKALLQIK